ncbi:MAG: starch-binding protein [Polyangiaceae bacterium]
MPNLRLLFERPSHFRSSVHVHVFGAVPGRPDTSWPGLEMRCIGDEWYEFVLDGVERANVVFNDACGAQTEDSPFL